MYHAGKYYLNEIKYKILYSSYIKINFNNHRTRCANNKNLEKIKMKNKSKFITQIQI